MKLSKLLLCLLFLFGTPIYAQVESATIEGNYIVEYNANQAPLLFIDGSHISDYEVIVRDDYSLIPVRVITEKFGATDTQTSILLSTYYAHLHTDNFMLLQYRPIQMAACGPHVALMQHLSGPCKKSSEKLTFLPLLSLSLPVTTNMFEWNFQSFYSIHHLSVNNMLLLEFPGCFLP